MGKIRIGSQDKWIKTIDKVNEKLEFTNNRAEGYDRDTGFYLNSEIEFVKFHFKDAYPEVADAVADPAW